MKKLMFIAAVALVAGCATKTRSVEIDGMFVQGETGILAIGTADVVASPVGEETAVVKYAEDTAWLCPSVKTHAIKIQLTGTNAVAKIEKIVDSICKAYGATTNAVMSAAK